MLIEALKTYFNIDIQYLETIKTIDTIVLKATAIDGLSYSVKLYKVENRELVHKIALTRPFLLHLQQSLGFTLQVPVLPIFPEITWQDSQRVIVVYPWLEGERLVSKDVSRVFEIGVMMAKMHLAAANFEHRIDGLLHINNELIQSVLPMILRKQQLFDFDESHIKAAFHKIAAIFEKYGNAADGLIHTDLHFGNMICRGELVIPIDFDELAYGYFCLDMAVVFDELEDYDGADVLKNTYLSGYQSVRNSQTNLLDDIAIFQRISACLYLNWLFAEANQELLLMPKYVDFAQKALARILS